MGSLVEGKALLTNSLQIVGFDHLAWIVFDSDFGAVKVRDHEVNTGKSLIESDFLFEKDISALSLELLVGLFLHNNDDIAGFDARRLIGLAMEGVLAIVRSALVDHGIENLLLFVHFLALANIAPVGLVDDLTLSTAVVARALRLGVHAGSKLGHFHDDTSTTAGCALLNSAFSSSPALANLTDSLSIHGNFRGFAIVNFLEGALERMHDWLAFLRSTALLASTSHSEHLLEDTATHATTSAATLSDSFRAVFVVCFTLLTIAQHLVGLLNFLELVFVTAAIGMVCSG